MKRERKPDDLALGRRLRRFREAAGLQRKQLADRVHISPDTLAIYENGWRGPSRPVLQRLADALGVSTDALLGLEPEDEVVQEIQLRHGISQVGKRLGPNHETLLRLYEHRREVAHGKLPPHVKARLLSRIDEIIREYQSLNRE